MNKFTFSVEICAMFRKEYNNFVRPFDSESKTIFNKQRINGNEARKLYLEEVGDVEESFSVCDVSYDKVNTKPKSNKNVTDTISNQDLYLTVQNNEVDKLRLILNNFPDKVNTLDEYGWSLLMIACQANSTECVEELLDRGIDVSIRDKAGNSARSLVIKNKNITLANILLSSKTKSDKSSDVDCGTHDVRQEYFCSICNKTTYPDKTEHLSSTIHNINASKGKKLPTNYKIPESNKGFQIMLKGGWDKETGLGSDGSGKKYPIRTVLKNDKRGLGHELNKIKYINEESKCKKRFQAKYHQNRRIEINFRRQFY